MGFFLFRRINRRIAWLWLAMLACAIWMMTVSWFASEDLGTATPLQFALIVLGFTVGLIVDELWRMWQWHVACVLHLEDVCDGYAPTEAAR